MGHRSIKVTGRLDSGGNPLDYKQISAASMFTTENTTLLFIPTLPWLQSAQVNRLLHGDALYTTANALPIPSLLSSVDAL